MTSRPRLLDLYAGAGGAARGYQRAGFHVTGIDHVAQPRYAGDVFVQSDALEYCREHGHEFDAIHASPPCQAYTLMRHFGKTAGDGAPDLVHTTRQTLIHVDRPFVIENVPGSPLELPVMLCGSMFGLGVRRHRLFESNWFIFGNPCRHVKSRRPLAVYGDHPQQPGDRTIRVNRARTLAEGQSAMGIDWMKWPELTQAIPPAYTEFVGRQLMHVMEAAA